MSSICVLLNGPIRTDSRVIKLIKTLSQKHFVDLYYIDGRADDNKIFNDNVKLFDNPKHTGLKNKIIVNTLFYNEFLYLAKAVLKQKIRYDYIYANDLPCLKPAIILKKKLGSQAVYDCHEIYIETLNQFFPEESKGLKGFLHKISLSVMVFFGGMAENKMVKEADICITVGHYVKEFLEKKFNIKNMYVLYNCPHLDASSKKFDFIARFGFNPNVKILLYQGVMNQGRALSEIIKAQIHTNEHIKFILIGDGPILMDLQNLVIDLKLENKVFFIDSVDLSVLLQYTRGADAGIILQESNKNLSKKLGIANKFFEYMHAGIPFLATDAPENRLVCDKYEVCKLIDSTHDIIEIAKAINSLFDDQLDKYKDAARQAATEYNWGKQEELIHSIIK